MNGYGLFLGMLAAYIGLLVGIGYCLNRRQTSLREFLLAGRRAGPLALGFSAAASWLTAGAMLAVIGFFMLLGMGSIWGFVAPNILALLIIALLVKKIRSVPAMTQPELLEMRYGSFLRLPVALIITTVMILFAVADIKGFALVLQTFYGISQLQAALIVALAVVVYVTLGGLSAVIATDTIQFVLLGTFALLMSWAVLGTAGSESGLTFSQLAATVDVSWWNPMAIGLPMVLIFTLSIIPGWISEQDPWQKIWAARDVSAARRGMVLGSLLVTLVFGCCALIALGLRNIYPEIAAQGFPMGMAQAEPALLHFILDQSFPPLLIAICAVALAAAAMSCADTFAASGASCISRDIYQRFINPAASMKEMLLVNRLAVLLIIVAATVGSFFITSIIEAIHIATFIASASYFFALMGGMYWRRATGPGAAASMLTGFFCQCGLIAVDLLFTKAGGPPYLETVHPVLMGHGVIVAMGVSGLALVVVSLLSAPVPLARLTPFFPELASQLAGSRERSMPQLESQELTDIVETDEGERVFLRLEFEYPRELAWAALIDRLTVSDSRWLALSGRDSARCCLRAESNSWLLLVRGNTSHSGWLEVEGKKELLPELRTDLLGARAQVLFCCVSGDSVSAIVPGESREVQLMGS